MIKSVINNVPAGAAAPIAEKEAEVEPAFRQQVWPWFTSARRRGELRAADGLVLRWFAMEAESDRAALVVLPGWLEIGESFAEELYDLRDLGISFYVLEQRCQGLSGGEIEPRDRWHVKDWRSFLSDIELFMEKVVRTRPHRKIILYGNSMGGALATTYLARHPGSAQALVLSVPMFGVFTAPLPLPVVTTVARLLKLLGKGAAYLPGHGPYNPKPFDGNSWFITSRARYEHLGRLDESRHGVPDRRRHRAGRPPAPEAQPGGKGGSGEDRGAHPPPAGGQRPDGPQ
jgi:alpha-beta hydrolase superfamily lysophospholipase